MGKANLLKLSSPISKVLTIGLAVFLVGILSSCSSAPKRAPGASRDTEAAAESTDNQKQQVSPAADAVDLIDQNLKRGTELPAGWPVDLIPLPEGASPIASLAQTTIPGSTAPATAVFYSASLPSQEIQELFARELPKKGWNLLESSPPGDSMFTVVEGNGYVGVFGTGKGLAESEAKADQPMTIQVVLAKA